MKKTFFLFAVLAVSAVAVGQDTVYGDSVFSNYIYSSGVSISRSDFPLEIKRSMLMSNGGEFITLCQSDDTVVVYGIAAVYGNPLELYWPREVHDTTRAHAWDTLKLYIPSGDTMVTIRRIPVNPFVTPTAYFLNCAGYPTDLYRYVERVIEEPFDSPVRLYGRFGLSRTFPHLVWHTYGRDGTGQYTVLQHYSGEPGEIHKQGVQWWEEDTILTYWPMIADEDEYSQRWNYEPHNPILIWPMIVPPGSNPVGTDTIPLVSDTVVSADTTVIVVRDTVFVFDTAFVYDTIVVCDTFVYGSDTIVYRDTSFVFDTIITCDTLVTNDTILGVSSAGLLGRLTGVAPNPAYESTQVVSSLGINRVEVFNTAGRRVFDQRVSGKSLSLTLDIRHWPQGTYLVRINTPMGVAVKKLVKR